MSRVVVVLGASSGFGRAAAELLARRGDRLVLAARTESSLDEVAARCRALGAETLVVPTDVAVEAQLERLVATTLERFGRVDVWVGVSAVFGFGSVRDTPTEVFERIVDVNLLGQVRGVRAVLPTMLGQGAGTIVLVGSLFSLVSAPYVSAYVASKHGLLGFARSLRQELLSTGVRVGLVLPASADTPIYQKASNDTGRDVAPLPPNVAPERVARAIVRATDRPAPRRRVGVIQSLAVPLDRLAPRLFDRGIRVAMDSLAILDTAADRALGALFEPRPEHNAVDGGWGRARRRPTR
jgi:NAD(P)-dependent dehydrogenase (short-subunit alcohol dehydrogenase family)